MIGSRAHPKGSIMKKYIVNECKTFLSMYLKDDEIKFNQLERNYDGSPNQQFRGLGVFSLRAHPFRHIRPELELPQKELDIAQWYVLSNYDEIIKYLE